MPERVYNNFAGLRVIDDGRVVEDVTSITLPTIKHSITSMKSIAGMPADLDMPNTAHLEAMDFSIAHNNGVNCRFLANPGKHSIEVRTARQRYGVAKAEIGHESVKYRFIAAHLETNKGSVEMNNPYGSTDKYSVIRYEEEIDDEVVTIVDAAAGILKWNGVDVTSEIEGILT